MMQKKFYMLFQNLLVSLSFLKDYIGGPKKNMGPSFGDTFREGPELKSRQTLC